MTQEWLGIILASNLMMISNLKRSLVSHPQQQLGPKGQKEGLNSTTTQFIRNEYRYIAMAALEVIKLTTN